MSGATSLLLLAICIATLGFVVETDGTPIESETRISTADLYQVTAVDPDTFVSNPFSAVATILRLVTNRPTVLESIVFIGKRLLDLSLNIFDGIRWKYSWVKPEVRYAQCISDSLLSIRFPSRHFNVLLKITYEFLGFVQNVLGDSLNERAGDILARMESTVKDDDFSFDGNDVNESLRANAELEAGALMESRGFVNCSQTYLTSIFIRILRLLYGQNS